MAKIGVLLSGCGVNDGSEIHEAVITLLNLDRAGAETVCMAPDVDQLDVVNHLTGEPTGEKRNVLVESARIARGNITDVGNVKAADIDGLIIPGGFGAAKNLSNFAVKGKDADVNQEVKRLLNEMVSAGKPVGAICIAPATLTKALEDQNPEVTIGNDISTAGAIEAMGGKHKECTVDMIHVDSKNKLVSTPAYMLGPGIKDVAAGIEKLVTKVLELV
ncbi:MAG: isoprenoid biosynthesis glyoxalase ElbB [Thermodesulfobacteriota bacterium]|nr:isoprenoid biosynthesis glyoxalase ElbB [Thermodesulfobacteriota bacterium]